MQEMALERRKARRKGQGRKMNGVESKRRGSNEEGVKERGRERERGNLLLSSCPLPRSTNVGRRKEK